MIKVKKLPESKWRDAKAIRLEALQEEPTAFASSYEEEKKLSAKDWKKRMKNTLFAMSRGKIVGMIVYVTLSQEKLKHITNIYAFYVSKTHRSKGVGKLLLEEALRRISENPNTAKINLHVNTKRKAAFTLYTKYGFKKVGYLKKDIFFDGVFYDEYIMEKYL